MYNLYTYEVIADFTQTTEIKLQGYNCVSTVKHKKGDSLTTKYSSNPELKQLVLEGKIKYVGCLIN